MAQDTTSFFGGTIPAVKFETIGDKVLGKVTGKELRQQTDMDTGKLLTWPDGRPKMMGVLTLSIHPDAREGESDDGLRTLYVRGYMQRAFVEAVRAAGRRDLNLGDMVEVEFTGRDEPTDVGRDGAKQFKVTLS